ncbi:MAG: family 1 glycosylhydrolase [Chitinophagales bacterium]|nr:family 1 glycosylhydrolase [Chitinophagales bacterium]
MTELHFPADFVFGTSTAAAQIETAFEHEWVNFTSKDGHIFNRTCDHELHREEDADIIAYCAPYYRMGFLWSKLQRAPLAPLHEETANEYERFLELLSAKGVQIMLVLHHFHNPNWFLAKGGWEKEENVALWVDFARKVSQRFGKYVRFWNTFNEPNVYASNGWITGLFPPQQRSIRRAFRVIRNLGKAHHLAYTELKNEHPHIPVGISHNAVIFSAENLAGLLPARISDWWFMDFCLQQFAGALDFFGMSYYAKISHDPHPITYIDTPDKIKKLNKPHDDMWEYYPQGMAECIHRYWKKYRLPIIITESGVCTSDDNFRISAMKEYLRIVHACMQSGVDIRGYFWWSTFDNFEWNLGPTYRFGLYETDIETKERRKRPSADVYRQVAYGKTIRL